MPSALMRRQASTIACRLAASSPALIASLRTSARRATPSQIERKRLVLAGAGLPRRQRRHRVGAIEPDIGVELLGQAAFGIVAPALRFRTIDYPDEAFESRRYQLLAQFRMLVRTQVEQEAPQTGIMREPLVGIGARGVDVLHFHRLVPVRGA